MLTRRCPDQGRVEGWLATASRADVTAPSGLTRGPPPRRWFVDQVDADLGAGVATFEAAADALRRWELFDLGWFVGHTERSPFAVGTTLASSARVAGWWWTYACRVTEIIDDEDDRGGRRVGFVYATIGSHAERGEERFLVSFDGPTRSVSASILAVSRPGRWFTWLGLPLARRTQRRLRPHCLAALARAVRVRTGRGAPGGVSPSSPDRDSRR